MSVHDHIDVAWCDPEPERVFDPLRVNLLAERGETSKAHEWVPMRHMKEISLEELKQLYPPMMVPERGENPKDRIGVTKPSLHLVPAAATIREAKVFELGAAKYGPYNWRDNAVKGTVYVSAALRHILSYLDGEDVDPESGQSHLAHARACTGILLDAMDTGNLVDDRPTKGAAAELIRELQVKKAA